MEHLDGVARRVVERDDLLDAAGIGLGQRQFLDGNARGVQGGLHARQGRAVAHLPPDGDDPVDGRRDDDDAGRALVHAEVQRIRLGAVALREAQHAEGEVPPAVHVGGLYLDVAQALQVTHARPQISARSGPCGSTPNELSADAW